MAGLIAVRSSLGNAILLISVTAWLLGSVFLAMAAYLAPHDMKTLRSQMRLRAERERTLGVGQVAGVTRGVIRGA